MINSLRSGVSGIRTHQARMDVIGNNIANVNTSGFKRSRVAFHEVLAQLQLGVGRIAGGSGTAVSDVNRLLKRFAEARKMVRKLSRLQRGGQGSSKKLARMLGGFGR